MRTRLLLSNLQRHAEAWCFIWGVAESLLFFIVPDVAISMVAVPWLARAFRCSLWAVAGAMCGGSLMYLWGHLSPASAMAALLALPAIHLEMVGKVQASLHSEGLVAMIWGPAKGIPYKIYAAQAGVMGLSFPAFVALTIPARIIRFIITCLGFHYVGKAVRKVLGEWAVPWAWVMFWVLNYVFYWGAHLGR